MDYTATEIIRNLPHPVPCDIAFKLFSAVGSYGIVWFVVLAVLVIYERRHKNHIFIPLIVSILLTTVAVNGMLKPFFGRLRPLAEHPPVLGYPTSFSFPSYHSAVGFAGAYILSVFHNKLKLLYFFIAFLTAFSRVYLGYHFLSDVIAGCLVGIAISYITCKIICGLEKLP